MLFTKISSCSSILKSIVSHRFPVSLDPVSLDPLLQYERGEPEAAFARPSTNVVRRRLAGLGCRRIVLLDAHAVESTSPESDQKFVRLDASIRNK